MRAKGFTLIELLIVVGLLTLVLGVAAPLMGRHLKDLSLKETARNAVQLMRYAQYRAIADGEARTVWPDTDENKFQIVRASGELDEGAKGTEIKLEPSVQIDPASDQITYYPDGSSSGGVLILRNASAAAEINVKPGLGRLEIAFADKKT